MRLLLIANLILCVLLAKFCQQDTYSSNKGYTDTNNYRANTGTNKSNAENASIIKYKANPTNQQEDEPIIDADRFPLVATLKGENMKAFVVAYEAFSNESEIPSEKKNIENYEITIRKNKNRFYVRFTPNFDEADPTPLGGENSLGKEVIFVIDRKDYKLRRRYFAE